MIYEGANNDAVGDFTCPVDGTPMLISAVYPGGALTNYQQWHNGAPETMSISGSSAAPIYIPSELKIGGMVAFSGFNWIGDIAIYALFSGSHSEELREAIQDEILADYGMAP